MNNNTLAAALVFSAVAIMATDASADITPAERTKAERFMNETNQKLFRAVQGLSEEQWNYKPAADRWSIAEVLEHITIIEETVVGILSKIDSSEPAPVGRDTAKIDAGIMATVLDRSEKFQAPPPARPTGRWTPAAALERFNSANDKLRATLESKHDLRAHVSKHPFFGPWDGYEWILGGVGHTARHTQQILEVKTDAKFPSR